MIVSARFPRHSFVVNTGKMALRMSNASAGVGLRSRQHVAPQAVFSAVRSPVLPVKIAPRVCRRHHLIVSATQDSM